MAGIFISHSSRDAELAAGVRERLAAWGHRSVFLDFDPACGIPAGRDWEKELYRQLRACRVVVAVVTPGFAASPWCFAEVTHARALGKPVFPVVAAACEVPALLRDRQIVDLASDAEAGYERLRRGMFEAGLDPGDLHDWDERRAPYPGLAAFQEEDAAVFFGRDDESREVCDTLTRQQRFGGERLCLLTAASGSGKSSLVRAGVFPRLRRDADRWLVLDPFRPRHRPFAELAAAFGATAERLGLPLDWRAVRDGLRGPDPGGHVADLARDLRAAAGAPDATLLLVVDQFEELLGDGASADADPFLTTLRGLVEAPEVPVIALATLRSDFLDAHQSHPALRGLAHATCTLGPLSAAGLSAVVEGPARVAALDLEDGLAAALVNDAATDDALPLLAFALRELWERRDSANRLTLRDYRDGLGGLHGSVARAGDDALSARPLSPEDLVLLRRAFVALATVRDDGRYVRRPAPWDELPAGVHEILERFVQARLLVSREDERGRVVEVAHEALFRSWQRLKQWLDEDREFLLWRGRLDTALQEHERAPRDRDGLLRGARLGEARHWLEARGELLSDRERAFVRRSAKLERRRRRLAFETLALVGLALTVLAVWALMERGAAVDASEAAAAAERSAREAEAGAVREARKARSRFLASSSERAMRDGLDDVGLLLAAEAVAQGRNAGDEASAEALAALRSALAGTFGRPLDTRGQPVLLAAFSPDDRALALLLRDGSLAVWELDALSGSPSTAPHELLDCPSREDAWTRAIDAGYGYEWADRDSAALTFTASGRDVIFSWSQAFNDSAFRLWDRHGPPAARCVDITWGAPEDTTARIDGRREWAAIVASGELRVWDLRAGLPLRSEPIYRAALPEDGLRDVDVLGAVERRDDGSHIILLVGDGDPAGDRLLLERGGVPVGAPVRVRDGWNTRVAPGGHWFVELDDGLFEATATVRPIAIPGTEAAPEALTVTGRAVSWCGGLVLAMTDDRLVGYDLPRTAGAPGAVSLAYAPASRGEPGQSVSFECARVPGEQWVLWHANGPEDTTLLFDLAHRYRPPVRLPKELWERPGGGAPPAVRELDGWLVFGDGRDFPVVAASPAETLGLRNEQAVEQFERSPHGNRAHAVLRDDILLLVDEARDGWFWVRRGDPGGPDTWADRPLQFDEPVRLPGGAESRVVGSPGGRWAVAYHGATARLFSTDDEPGRPLERTREVAEGGDLRAAFVPPNGDFRLTTSLRVTDRGGALAATLAGDGVCSVARSGAGAGAVVFEGRLPLEENEYVGALPDGAPPEGARVVALLDVSPDGRWLLGVSQDVAVRDEGVAHVYWGGFLVLWALRETGAVRHEPLGRLTSDPNAVLFAPDGPWFALTNRYYVADDFDRWTTFLWRLPEEGPLPVPMELRDQQLAWRPQLSTDGRWLATWSDRPPCGGICLWDLHAAAPTVTPVPLVPHLAPCFGFDPEGRGLAVPFKDDRVEFWSLDPDGWVQVAIEAAGRTLREDEWRRYVGDLPYEPLRPGPAPPR